METRATTGISPRGALVPLLGLFGAALAALLISRAALEPSAVLILSGLFIAFVAGLNLPAFQWLPLGQRSLLTLFALRPLLDATQLRQAFSKAGLSLQNAYAMVIVAILVVLWRKSDRSYAFDKIPNSFVFVLLVLAVIAWVTGGLSAGANGFVRTAWGLVVALFLGPLFRTERQIDIFIRTVFYSSVFVLLILSFNLRGEYLGDSWRVGGQYGVPNALAAIAFTLFAYGLYVVGQARTETRKLVDLSLLALLGAVIMLTQSRTVGALMMVSLCVWLWMKGHRRLLYWLGIPLLTLLIGSGIALGWRLTSAYSFEDKELSADVVNLTGRTVLWMQTLGNYADSSFLHKIIGIGWGAVFQNFMLTDVADLSSVTENSFLWFLAGTGALGLIAFCAYLAWMASRAWTAWRTASSKFEQELALLALLAVATFVIEGSTTDLVLSPLSSGYLYAILSIFACRWLENRSRTTSTLQVQDMEKRP
jgi:O-Antigen ligase